MAKRSRLPVVLHYALGILSCLLGPVAASSQTAIGSILGTAGSSNGSAQPRVAVVLKSDRGDERTVTTSGTGNDFPGAVPPGTYTLEATLEDRPSQRAADVRARFAAKGWTTL